MQIIGRMDVDIQMQINNPTPRPHPTNITTTHMRIHISDHNQYVHTYIWYIHTNRTNTYRNLMPINTHTHIPHPNNIIIYLCVYHDVHMTKIGIHICDTHIHTRRMHIEIWCRSTLTLIAHTPTASLYIHVYTIIYTWWKSGNVNSYDRHIHNTT